LSTKYVSIEAARADKPFISIKEVARRTDLTTGDIEILASADAFRELIGDRFKARWEVSALTPHSELLQKGMVDEDELLMPQPSIEQNVMNDYASIGLTLRTHPMAILRAEFPFNKCKQYSQLVNLAHKSFVRVAGIVTGKQRPGTASGVLFMSLEDETGTSNVVIWTATQQRFRTEILTGKLLVITGTVEILAEKVSTPVVHVIAGNIQDFSKRLDSFSLKSRDFH
ncbi:MAG: error-prone DNA polymerase, partial [Moraxellaceae bacterium]